VYANALYETVHLALPHDPLDHACLLHRILSPYNCLNFLSCS